MIVTGWVRCNIYIYNMISYSIMLTFEIAWAFREYSITQFCWTHQSKLSTHLIELLVRCFVQHLVWPKMANTQKKMVSPIGSIYWFISVVSGCVFLGKPRRTIKMICSAKRIPRCECCEASTPGTGHEGWKPGGLVKSRWVCCFEKECLEDYPLGN